MKKKVTILLLALCLVFLAACGSSSPTDALKADLENAKSSPDEIIKGLGADGFGEDATKALIDKVLEFDYEFGEEKIDGDTATVETTITTYPFGEIFTNIIISVFSPYSRSNSVHFSFFTFFSVISSFFNSSSGSFSFSMIFSFLAIFHVLQLTHLNYPPFSVFLVIFHVL